VTSVLFTPRKIPATTTATMTTTGREVLSAITARSAASNRKLT